MPELPDPKHKPHVPPAPAPAHPAIPYAELHVTSNFSFLQGASHPEELIAQAKTLGHHAIALTDLHTLGGIVRAHTAAKEHHMTFLVGARIEVRPWELEEQKALRHKDTEALRETAATNGAPSAAPAPLSALVPQCLSASPSSPSPTSLLLYPASLPAYNALCRLLTLGKRRSEKGECRLTWHDLPDHAHPDLLAIYVPPENLHHLAADTPAHLSALRDLFPSRLYVGMTCLYEPADAARLAAIAHHADAANLPLIALNDVHYHTPARRALQDVLTCIRHGCTLDDAGFRLHANAERHLKDPAEMARLFRAYPQAIANTVRLATRAAAFSLDQLKYEYPNEICPPGKTLMQHLEDLTWQGAQERYGEKAPRHEGTEALREAAAPESAPTNAPAPLSASVPQCLSAFPPAPLPPSLTARLAHEFSLIAALNYPAYFLTVYDIVQFARSRGILCQGRGAAANSAVCYCLGITNVDPSQIDLLVERFISKERNEPPDIDIDFEHERREEVIQYIYNRFGRDRAALCAEVITYRRRSAIRDVGKALGLSLDCVDRLAKAHDWWDKQVINEPELRNLGLDPHDPTIRRVVALARELLGFPRHRSQHVGGFIITERPLSELVPIENAAMPDRTVIEWDKDDIEDMGMLKIDILGLGMLTAIRKAMDMANAWGNSNDEIRMTNQCSNDECPNDRNTTRPLALHTIPLHDPAVYNMLCRADSVGVFQVESRAQMAMLPRLKPQCYYDLVVQVAIVRPGPIQGGMVHPYLRRRNGEEPVSYPSDAVKNVLERTLGVPLFQEQVMRLSMVAAGFTGGEADQLRRAMAAWKRKGDLIEKFGNKIVTGMLARGYASSFAHQLLEQIKGFGEYGFPESHAASFAHLVYASAYLKHHHPAAFTAALLNSQPMGFYAPAQLIRDAKEHGVTVLPADVNRSQWDCTLEAGEEALRHKDTEALREAAATDGAPTAAPAPLSASGPQRLSAFRPPHLRLGLRLIRSLPRRHADRITAAVAEHGAFRSIPALWRAARVPVAVLRTLASADAFTSMGLSRQQALWIISTLRDEPLPLLEPFDTPDPLEPALPAIPADRLVACDYAATGLSLKAHPMSFARDLLDTHNVLPAGRLADPALAPHNHPVAVAGIVLVRQRPGTASGILFITIEDETGTANLVVRPHIYQAYKPALRHASAILVRGHIERQGQVVHIIVRAAEDIRNLQPVKAKSRDFH